MITVMGATAPSVAGALEGGDGGRVPQLFRLEEPERGDREGGGQDGVDDRERPGPATRPVQEAP